MRKFIQIFLTLCLLSWNIAFASRDLSTVTLPFTAPNGITYNNILTDGTYHLYGGPGTLFFYNLLPEQNGNPATTIDVHYDRSNYTNPQWQHYVYLQGAQAYYFYCNDGFTVCPDTGYASDYISAAASVEDTGYARTSQDLYYNSSLYMAANVQPGVTNQFLNFPIPYGLDASPYTAYTAPVSSVMDHSMPGGPYSENDLVLTFNGEQGSKSNSYHLGCYASNENTAFNIGLHYVGTTSTGGGYYLCYDGHPGYDYSFLQGTNIRAPASGTLCVATTHTNVRSPTDVWREAITKCPLPSVVTERWLDSGGYNAFYIFHPSLYINGSTDDYMTVFLHSTDLENTVRRAVESDGYATVVPNQSIATVGDVGASGAYHMHLEVYKKNVSTGDWDRVDPYGDGTNNILWPH